MSIKKLTAIVMVLIMVLTISACGSKTPDQSGTEGTQGSDQTQKAPFGMADPESYKATLTMWSHTADQPNFMIKHYNEVYPNVTINFEVIPGNEHQHKVQTAVASGVDVPDIYTVKTDFVKMIANSDKYYDDLFGEPYNATHLRDNLEPYTVEVGSDANGGLRAVTWQCPVVAIYYRRSIAKELFGTDDPSDISAMFKDMDSIVTVARQINEKSNGEIKLIGAYDQLRPLYCGNMSAPFVKDGVINIDPMLIEYFETAKILYDEDLDMKTQTGNANFSGLMAEGKMFSLISATWALNFQLMPVYPDTEGDWGLASPPVPSTMGGTWMGIYPGTKHKEEAYTFINYVFTNEDFLFKYATELGDYVSNPKVQKTIAELPPEETIKLPVFKFCNNQNVYEFFNNELKNGVRAELFSEYDYNITNTGILFSAIDMYITGQKTLEEAINQYCDDLIAIYPDLKRP